MNESTVRGEANSPMTPRPVSGLPGLGVEYAHPLKAEHGAETVGDSGRGAVERRVGRVDGYAPRYSSNHRTLHGGSAGDMPETFEYEWVM